MEAIKLDHNPTEFWDIAERSHMIASLATQLLGKLRTGQAGPLEAPIDQLVILDTLERISYLALRERQFLENNREEILNGQLP